MEIIGRVLKTEEGDNSKSQLAFPTPVDDAPI